LWKDICSEELFAFLGLCIVSGILRTRKEPVANLWTTCAKMVKDQFIQILCVIHFYDKTTRNQWRSTDKIAPISDVFEGTISRFQMANTPYEHITTDEQLMVFRGKCPLHVFIKSKPIRYGIKLWVADEPNTFYACNMQVYTGKNDGVRQKEQGL
jgi:hypothetical protein